MIETVPLPPPPAPMTQARLPVAPPVAQPERFAPQPVVATAPIAQLSQLKTVSIPAPQVAAPPAIRPPLLTPPATATGQPAPIQMVATPTAIFQALNPAPTPTPPAPISPQVGGIFTSGPGVGYTSSFSGIKAFVPIVQRPGQNITFAEGQAFVDTENGNPSANLVVGHRFTNANRDRVSPLRTPEAVLP